MLFQAAHNLTWFFATFHHCLEHTRSCVGEHHKIGFLGISEYAFRLNGKWHTVTSSWKVSKIKNFICQSLWRVTEAASGWHKEIQNLAVPDFILKCHLKYTYQLPDRLKKIKNELQKKKKNESSELHFISHLFPTNRSHSVPICKYIQHSCNIYNVRISSTPCIYLLCKILPLKEDYRLKRLNRLVFVIQY